MKTEGFFILINYWNFLLIVDHRLQYLLKQERSLKYSCEPVKQIAKSVIPRGATEDGRIDYLKVTECGCVLQWEISDDQKEKLAV